MITWSPGVVLSGVPLSGQDMLVVYMGPRTVSEDTVGSDSWELFVVGTNGPFVFFRATGLATTAAYVAPPSWSPSCCLQTATFCPMTSAAVAVKGSESPQDAYSGVLISSPIYRLHGFRLPV